MNQKIDYLINGLGLAGSTLAWELITRGKKVIVYDNPAGNKASAVAAGLFNPVTGKYLVKTWQADVIFPFFEQFYISAEKQLHQNFFHLLPIFSPFSSIDERNFWKSKIETAELMAYARAFHETPCFTDQVNNPLGGIEIGHSGYLNVQLWTKAIRDFLIQHNSYVESVLDESEITFDEGVNYGGFQANKIIFCNGIAASESRWFKNLPLIPLKGEVLQVKMNTRMERIYNRGVYIVPGPAENIYTVGSTYDRPPFETGITSDARESLESKLMELTPCGFEIVHQNWGIRPTTIDRRPVLGAHPDNKNVILFNGLGTKGVSLAPYLAHHLADWLEGQGELLREVNICRFKALYSG